MSFNDLGLAPPLIEALATLNYKQPTPIQKAAIPTILSGKDVLGIAQTGSGKTASFVLPVLMNLQKGAPLKNRQVKVLVLVPTRELAMQVNEIFQQFGKVMPQRIKSLAVFGGVSINPQMIALQNVHVLTATPGRLLELVASKAVHLSDVKTLILDEADKMLNRSFQDEINEILALLPQKRQNLLFSATLSKEVKEIKQMLLEEPTVIEIETESTNIDLIHQSAYLVAEERKGPFLRYLIKTKELKQVLVFASSTKKATNIAIKLNKNGIEALCIHSQKSQGARTKALAKFKSGEVQVLVTTDLLSRGIDIEFLPCVINYELPRSPKDYIHRIGRTGRAEASGEAISLVTNDELHHFKIIQKKMGKWIQLSYTEEVDLHGY
ncbi:MAG: DEAD/DEAH box helicase [Chitinophagales bacterium]